MKQIIATLMASAFSPVTFWLGGADLTQRGEELAICFVFAVGAAVATWACPLWKEVRA
jgi:hypothetical protein